MISNEQNWLMANEFFDRPLKRPPIYGVFRWWPENGEGWIHPFDVGMVRQLVPSNRVFRREDHNDEYVRVIYGGISFRIRPTLWLQVEYEGLDIGDYVEVKSRMGKTVPFVGRVRDLRWNNRYKRIEYLLHRSSQTQDRAYRVHELTLIASINSTQPLRHNTLLAPGQLQSSAPA